MSDSIAPSDASHSDGDLYEVFIQTKGGQPFAHVGSVHANDSTMAIQVARDVYTRRPPVNGMWVVKSDAIHSTDSSENEMMFSPADDKIYRHVKFYNIPKPPKGDS